MAEFEEQFARALERRRGLLADPSLGALRLLHGAADGVPGVFIDRYGPGATLIRHLGRAPAGLPEPRALAQVVLRHTARLGVRAVYDKPFTLNRSRLGGSFHVALSEREPLAGEPLEPSILVRERARSLEVRLYDGFSTGLFLDQRENRGTLGRLCAERPGARVLNTFGYTCAFSVACAMDGAATTSVDVSARYLDWGRRNFAHNGLEPSAHHFARMDTFEYLAYARRKKLRYDLVILDPPTFSAANGRRGIPAWSAVKDYPRLLKEAADRLDPAGARLLFVSTNATDLCRAGRLRAMVTDALGVRAEWMALPSRPDFPDDEDAAACALGRVP